MGESGEWGGQSGEGLVSSSGHSRGWLQCSGDSESGEECGEWRMERSEESGKWFS